MLDTDDILQLWQLGGRFREIAADEMIADLGRHGATFFRLLSDDAPLLEERASREMCFLHSGLPSGDSSVPVAPEGGYNEFVSLAARYDAFVGAMRAAYAASDRPHVLAGMLYSLFPGIRAEIRALDPEVGSENEADEEIRQLMVFVCGQCNLHCPYCFSHDLQRTEISEADLRRIFQWAVAQGCSMVTPCGGEPLLYTHLPLFMRLVEEYGMTTYLASNCTAPMRGLPGFKKAIVKRLYVHFTRESLADSAMRRTVDDNIAFCKEQEIEMAARINITSPDETAALQWVDITREHGIKRLNIALTIPSRFAANRYTDPSDFERYVPVIMRMFDYARQSGIALGIAKPLPLCLFPEDVALEMLRADSCTALCGIHQSGYMNNLSLSTDMAFSPCLGLTDVRIPFDDAPDWAALSRRFAPGVERLLNRDASAKCARCFLKSRGLCQGYCLSYKYREEDEF